jgi:hypothetical protein
MRQYPHHSRKIRSGAKIYQKRGFLAKPVDQIFDFPQNSTTFANRTASPSGMQIFSRIGIYFFTKLFQRAKQKTEQLKKGVFSKSCDKARATGLKFKSEITREP